MSIWDQKFHGELPSTTNIDRKIPSEIMANGTTSINPAKEAELLDGEPYVSIRDGSITVNDGSSDIIKLGLKADGSYGADNMFRIVDEQTASATKAANSTDTTVDVSHGLSFTPSYLVYVRETTGTLSDGVWYFNELILTHLEGSDGGITVAAFAGNMNSPDKALRLSIATPDNGAYYDDELTVEAYFFLLRPVLPEL